MSQSVNMADLLTLIEEAAKGARVSFAHAAMLTANMDINAGKAGEQHVAAMKNLLYFTSILHQSAAPPDPNASNGRLKIA